MSFEFESFDVEENVQEDQGFSPLPKGTYTVVVNKSEMTRNPAGDTDILALTYQISEARNQNRLVFDNLRLASTKAESNPGHAVMVRIAKSNLSAICKACGIDKLRSADSLIGRRLNVSVKVVPHWSKQGEFVNEVCGYSPATAAKPTPNVDQSSGAVPAVNPLQPNNDVPF